MLEIAKHNKALWVAGGLLLVMSIFLMNRHNIHTFTAYDVKGEVILIPTNAESKNYRVKVLWTISGTPRGFYGEKRSYKLDYVTWPNGGTTEFPECTIIPLEEKNFCEDIDSKKWKIEVQSDPLY